MARILPTARVLWLVLLAVPFPASAQDPAASPTTRLIPYSAALPDAGPDAIAGARTVTFALFDEAEGGTLLWTETQTVNLDARGRYSAHLGAVTALPLEIFRSEQARWLEVTVDGTALPRTMLVAVPYALRAADAETLGGKQLSEFVLTDGSGRRVRADGTTIDDPAVDGTGVPNQLAKWNGATTLSSSIVAESFDNRIGILAPDPTGGGVVDSRFTIRHLDNNTAIAVLNTSNQRRFALNTTSTGGFQFFDGAGGNWNAGVIQQNGQLTLGPAVGLFSNSAKLRAFATPAERSAILARKSGADLFSRAIAARSGAGVAGPLITAFVGLDDNSDFGGPNAAVWAENFTAGGIGVMAIASAAAAVGIQASGPSLAGQFFGNVSVSGTLTKGGGAFEIDHPLDPANKYLRHSFVESPDMMNVYNGNVTLDAKGEAWVTLPEWFEALNRDFRYQLTSIGGPATPYVAAKISGNRFKIAGGVPDGEVSWQVTGIRQDAWANTHRIQVEQDKKGDDAGRYLHPDVYGLGSEMAAPSARPNAGVMVRKDIR